MPFKTLVNGAVSLWGQHQTNKNIDKQLRAQQLENEKNRQYNLSLAIKQNKWNLQQWSRENAYNSPIAQMRRMEAAGLNPDMMYGGGVSGNLSASSPSMTSGAPSSPMDWSSLASKKTISQAAMEAAQLDNLRAQTDKVKAETQGQQYSNDILESDAAFRDAWNSGLLRKQDVEIQLIGSQKNLSDENVSLVRQEVKQTMASTEQLQKNLKLIEAQINNYDADTAYKRIKADIDKRISDSELKSMAAKRNLDYAQAKRILEELPYLITQYQDQHGFTLEQGAMLKRQGNMLQLQLDKESNNPRHNAGYWKHIYQGIDFVNDLVEALSPIIPNSSISTSYSTVSKK